MNLLNKVSEHLKKSGFLRKSSVTVAFGSSLIWLFLVANANFKSLASLLKERHQYLGWSDWVMQDMKATARGMFIYSNPDAGYTGLLYTPLFTFLNAAFLKVFWWEGWRGLIYLFRFFDLIL